MFMFTTEQILQLAALMRRRKAARTSKEREETGNAVLTYLSGCLDGLNLPKN